MRADPAFFSSYQQLTDLRQVDSSTVSSNEIRERACTSLFDPGVRRAIVVGSDVMFGLSRMFAAYAESSGQVIRVFREMLDAEAWLDAAAA